MGRGKREGGSETSNLCGSSLGRKGEGEGLLRSLYFKKKLLLGCSSSRKLGGGRNKEALDSLNLHGIS